ncbi:MAG: hypothetical protein ACRCVX_14180 [Shewanella sp.]
MKYIFFIMLLIGGRCFAQSDFPERFGYAGVGVYTALATQTLTTNAATQVVFSNSDMNCKGLSRTGNVFTCTTAGAFIFTFQPQVFRIATGGKCNFWILKNGVATANSTAYVTLGTNNESTVLCIIFPVDLAVGDTVSFAAQAASANAYRLDFTAAAGVIPATPAVILTVQSMNLNK